MAQLVNTTRDLRDVVSRVSFERSCLDMGWEWLVHEAEGGWLLSCSFQRPDRDSGKLSRGFGRQWFVDSGTTVSGVVKTMFAAAKMIVDHEIMEAFKFDGERPFDPHHEVEDLCRVGKPS